MSARVPSILRRAARSVRSLWQGALRGVCLKLVVVCVIVSTAVLLMDALRIVPRVELLRRLGLSWAGLVERRWVFQLVTWPLIHGDIVHLFFNMLVLWMFAPVVEESLGRRGTILLLVTAHVGATAAFLAIHVVRPVVVMGASGLVYGLLVAGAFLRPNMLIRLFFFFPIKLKYAVWILAAIAFFLTVSPDEANISHVSHLGGAVGAAVYMLVRRKIVSRSRSHGAVTPADWSKWAIKEGKLGWKRGSLFGRRRKRDAPTEL